MTPNPPISAAVEAVLAKLDAPRRVKAAVWSLYHDHHMSAPSIANALRDALRARGLTEDQIKGAGVSHDSIRAYVKGDRPEKGPDWI